ncbi:MAG: HAD family hydrolase [Candidatus Humimicrobiaceae bacterium]
MLKKKEIKLVIFDIGKVILDFDHMITCNKLAKYSKKDAGYIYDFIFNSEMLDEYERGEINSMEIFSAISDELGLDISFEKFKEIWSNIFTIKEGIEQLIHQVKTLAKIAVLSNTDEMHFEDIRDKVEIIKDFDWLFLSHETGYRKPEKEIFEYAINKTGISPENIIFIDDIQEFVKAANKLGITGILYKDIITLKKDLEFYLDIIVS